MQKTLIQFLAFLCFSLAARAQSVRIDSTFSQDGFVSTSIWPVYMYCRLMALNPEGEILVGGAATAPIQGVQINRYNATGDSVGTILLSQNGQFATGTYAVAIQEDGKILFNVESKVLRRFNADGSPDFSFGIHGSIPLNDITIWELMVAPNGKIYGAGYRGISNAIGVIIAFDANGQPDTTFSDDGIFEYTDGDLNLFFSMAFQNDGKMVVSGFTYTSGTDRIATVVRITTAGVADTTFGTGGAIRETFTGGAEAYSVAVQPDQKVVLCGYTFQPYRAIVARYLENGQRDSTFGTFGVSNIHAFSEGTDILLKQDGKLLIYAWKSLDKETHKTGLIQLMPNGDLDSTFAENGVFFSPHLGLEPPMTFEWLNEQTIVACGNKNYPGSAGTYHYMSLQRFILDLNVGTIPTQGSGNEGLLIYPNPLGSTFALKFDLEQAQSIDIYLLDMQGKQISTLQQGVSYLAGSHEAPLSLDQGIPPGTYILSLRASGGMNIGIQIIKQ